MAITKKNPTKKTTSSSLPSSHPPYLQMISDAITTMKDRTGSSQPAIAKFIEENYSNKLPPNFKKTLLIQLKRFVKSEKLVKVKNSYKVPAPEKAKKATDVAAAKKPATKSSTAKNTTVKSSVARKTVAKAVKTKRLSQVKTPEGLKKTKTVSRKAVAAVAEKVIKNKAVTPVKRKSVRTPAAKKARK